MYVLLYHQLLDLMEDVVKKKGSARCCFGGVDAKGGDVRHCARIGNDGGDQADKRFWSLEEMCMKGVEVSYYL